MPAVVENFVSSIQGAAIPVVHNKIFFFQAYFAFLCQRVEVWPTVLDPHELLYVFFFNLVNRTNVIGTNVTVTS